MQNENKVASFDELYETINKTLTRNGQSEKIKSAIRAQVFSSLMTTDSHVDDSNNLLTPTNSEECNPPRENLLINEMINEYLLFNGYVHTASVFQTELCNDKRDNKFDQNGESDRAIIRYELGLSTNIDSISNEKNKKKLPILYNVISVLKKQKEKRQKHQNKELVYRKSKI